MTFEEWHEKQTHKAYQSHDCLHYEWEKFAWNAAIDYALELYEDYSEDNYAKEHIEGLKG